MKLKRTLRDLVLAGFCICAIEGFTAIVQVGKHLEKNGYNHELSIEYAENLLEKTEGYKIILAPYRFVLERKVD